jgi:hypothetical protein
MRPGALLLGQTEQPEIGRNLNAAGSWWLLGVLIAPITWVD